MASRETLGGHLAERDWMTRVLDETHARMDELATVQRYRSRSTQRQPDPQRPPGPRIHAQATHPGAAPRRPHPRSHPGAGAALDDDGVVSGAVALDRASGRTVRVEAAAVVLGRRWVCVSVQDAGV